MSTLRNPDLRIRDIRKIVTLKSQFIKWDEGCDKKNEWVLASSSCDKDLDNFMLWLQSKNVPPDNECIITNSSWHEPKKIIWQKIIASPSKYFGGEGFELYDIDLKWVLEYAAQEVARYGKFKTAKKA